MMPWNQLACSLFLLAAGCTRWGPAQSVSTSRVTSAESRPRARVITYRIEGDQRGSDVVIRFEPRGLCERSVRQRVTTRYQRSRVLSPAGAWAVRGGLAGSLIGLAMAAVGLARGDDGDPDAMTQLGLGGSGAGLIVAGGAVMWAAFDRRTRAGVRSRERSFARVIQCPPELLALPPVAALITPWGQRVEAPIQAGAAHFSGIQWPGGVPGKASAIESSRWWVVVGDARIRWTPPPPSN